MGIKLLKSSNYVNVTKLGSTFTSSKLCSQGYNFHEDKCSYGHKTASINELSCHNKVKRNNYNKQIVVKMLIFMQKSVVMGTKLLYLTN